MNGNKYQHLIFVWKSSSRGWHMPIPPSPYFWISMVYYFKVNKIQLGNINSLKVLNVLSRNSKSEIAFALSTIFFDTGYKNFDAIFIQIGFWVWTWIFQDSAKNWRTLLFSFFFKSLTVFSQKRSPTSRNVDRTPSRANAKTTPAYFINPFLIGPFMLILVHY